MSAHFPLENAHADNVSDDGAHAPDESHSRGGLERRDQTRGHGGDGHEHDPEDLAERVGEQHVEQRATKHQEGAGQQQTHQELRDADQVPAGLAEHPLADVAERLDGGRGHEDHARQGHRGVDVGERHEEHGDGAVHGSGPGEVGRHGERADAADAADDAEADLGVLEREEGRAARLGGREQRGHAACG
ncbi:unnamed protein product [Phytophthora lilii]|uniref:Unnamed protein product n=1 Tax=Phytophthora lilii TaxID=2077276 RepID=A0A9W6UCC0_9STRA|nr:unnamed protein product [Phytophthora lilii]